MRVGSRILRGLGGLARGSPRLLWTGSGVRARGHGQRVSGKFATSGAEMLWPRTSSLREAIASERRQKCAVANIHSAILGLQNGDVKECRNARVCTILTISGIKRLFQRWGRFCKHCKSQQVITPLRRDRTSPSTSTQYGPKPCPQCNSKMILRRGRYGPFYGGSRYPCCKGIRETSGQIGRRSRA